MSILAPIASPKGGRAVGPVSDEHTARELCQSLAGEPGLCGSSSRARSSSRPAAPLTADRPGKGFENPIARFVLGVAEDRVMAVVPYAECLAAVDPLPLSVVPVRRITP